MTNLLVQATRQIDEAIGYLGSDDDRATAAADAAIKTARQLQHCYYSETAVARARGHPRAHRVESSTANASESARS